ncbi:MAG: hypothetical protein F2838_08720 [Actinobacteria bacterium]|nr:hypothetical protein [Actinomycetota bacterium]
MDARGAVVIPLDRTRRTSTGEVASSLPDSRRDEAVPTPLQVGTTNSEVGAGMAASATPETIEKPPTVSPGWRRTPAGLRPVRRGRQARWLIR